ncbi:prepilin-type N-terminal cleavage/methylation domain-containing protein [Aureisphaera galaxeae]|uniref:prepilin-type N-terminal cleavage/methylation domain-containing protein n=1 Tax=Aureisphaera galaxeae TaxID=1538023 RepID=UPI0023509837|nr:prepilin-type N-terminal cleavage/methylation domain-containing protein [Aureisphaera galaxeae]MDC8005224.1 prepilin-type N-terminal cleavage/methylation domain-containing protein [Aureisphaera galaxeae]
MKVKKIDAFTLNEMLMVLAIIGILLLIALPQVMPLIATARGQEAKIQLKYIANLQEQHRFMNSKFSADFNNIDFEAPKTVHEGGTANYRYELVAASVTSFKARAEAVVDFDGDGVYNVWEIDENGNPKEITKD